MDGTPTLARRGWGTYQGISWSTASSWFKRYCGTPNVANRLGARLPSKARILGFPVQRETLAWSFWLSTY